MYQTGMVMYSDVKVKEVGKDNTNIRGNENASVLPYVSGPLHFRLIVDRGIMQRNFVMTSLLSIDTDVENKTPTLSSSNKPLAP